MMTDTDAGIPGDVPPDVPPEEMSVSLLKKGGRYEVQSASGNRYEVDVIGESYTCPDWQRSPAGGCKHLRRVDHEIKRGRVPRTDGRLPADAD